MKKKSIIAALTLSAASLISLNSCSSLFIFGNTTYDIGSIETFEGCSNSVFFALYNYYGIEGQHFTNKWLGMNDALKEHGITVTGYENEKDARKFSVTRESNSDLPSDAKIFMVNNQNWDSGIQYTKPIAQYKPMAIISTCNGVEFASSPILSSGIDISNATMGGFSDSYKAAFENGSLKYLCAKYSAHVLPIFAACVDAVEKGSAMKNSDGTALKLSISNWNIQTLDEYNELEMVDSVSEEHPTVRKINIDKFFDTTSSYYGAANLTNWVADSSKETMKALYEENGLNSEEDVSNYRKGEKIKFGIIAPSSVNDSVQKYIDFIKGYCATAYNCQALEIGAVTSSNTQDQVAKTLINQGAKFIISLQDDTNRNLAANVCEDNGVYFAIGGSCQNPVDYEIIKNNKYYVGSAGTSIDDEREAAYEMTNYYLNCMIHRAKGDLTEWQAEYKGLNNKEEGENE